MRTFSPKQDRPQGPASSSLARSNNGDNPIFRLQHTIGNRAVGRMLYASSGGPPVQRQPAPAPSPPAQPAKTWSELMKDLRRATKEKDKLGLVQELVAVAEAPGYDLAILNEGMALAAELSKDAKDPLNAIGVQVPTATVDRLLRAVQRRFKEAFQKVDDLPTGGSLQVGGTVLGDPGALIAMGQKAARGGQHDRAFQLFGLALEILSFMAMDATDKSEKDALSATAIANVFKRDSRYKRFKGIYDEMREIYRFYYVLEAEALDANETVKAAEARERASKLHGMLADRIKDFRKIEVETAESTQIRTPQGQPAFRFQGANHESTDLTELPGHPFSQKLLASKESLEPEELGLLQGALVEQAEFQAEIAREAQIRKAFGKDPVDLNDEAKRQKVWRIMYGVYKDRGPGPLGSLMSLMGRYLKAHTYHTGYNVADFGPSYLDLKFPSDLAGRLVRDCGVYALTVAWDVFRTMKASDSKLKLKFTLATLLDHIILIITDEAAEESYLVNNDQITRVARPPAHLPLAISRGTQPGFCQVSDDPAIQRPKAPDLDEEVGQQYALFRDLPYLVSPVNYMGLGSTADAEGSFKAALWQRYLTATQHMAKVPVDFLKLQGFSQSAAILDQLLDDLGGKLATSGNHVGLISAWLQTQWQDISVLRVRFTSYGANSFQGLPAPAGSRNGGAFRWRGTNHPLVRVALLLLYLRKLGGIGSLTGEQRLYLTNFEGNVVFKEWMDKGRAGAEAGQF